MAAALREARAHESELALLFIDIDDFKRINDSHGHLLGDTLLRAVGQRLRSIVRDGDVLARPGGDEFLLLVKRAGNMSDIATDLAARVVNSLREPFEMPARTPLEIRASVGVSTYPRDADTIEDLMRHADAAMYIAKGGGKDSFHVYHAQATPTGREGGEAFDATGAVDELNRILAAQDVATAFQPIVEIESAAVIGYEALTRGPEGSPLQRPDRLFAAALAADRVDELDWLCRARAVCAALDAGLGRSAALFLNSEPPPSAPPVRRSTPRSRSAPSPSSTSCWRSPSGRSPTALPSSRSRSPSTARPDGGSRSTTSAPTSVRWRCCP